MRKTASFPPRYFSTPLKDAVIRLGHQYQSVLTYLLCGPHSHLSGIYGLQLYQLAEDLHLEPDEARTIVAGLESLGWCTYARPVIWIHGLGCQTDQLGADFRKNASNLIATLRHVESLPEDNAAVRAWRAAHDLTGITADAISQQHPRRRADPAPEHQAPGIRHEALGIGIGTASRPPGSTPRRTTRATTGKGALREGQP